jgi:hypothetical protein
MFCGLMCDVTNGRPNYHAYAAGIIISLLNVIHSRSPNIDCAGSQFILFANIIEIWKLSDSDTLAEDPFSCRA